mmetsp:Transcript_73891/g.213843  ORF Transcript_73891/g.213843 Transcript_73891/m.213843 type:complete len:98 (+) Transcript_73891:347-640(+)
MERAMTMLLLEVAAQEEMEHGQVVVVDEQEVADALVVGAEEVVDEDEDEILEEEVVPTARQVNQNQEMIKAMRKIIHCIQMRSREERWSSRLSFQGH